MGEKRRAHGGYERAAGVCAESEYRRKRNEYFFEGGRQEMTLRKQWSLEVRGARWEVWRSFLKNGVSKSPQLV